MAEILLENVSRVFPNGVKALERLNLTVQDGELLALVGPSGCGKSTTLRLIAGLDAPTTGGIRIGGRDMDRVPARDRNIALVFQRVALFPHRTVFDNIAFGLRLRNKAFGWRRWLGRRLDADAYNSEHSADSEALTSPRRVACGDPTLSQREREGSAAIAKQVREAAGVLGIESLLQRRPGELSGGEQQRVALAKALVGRPQALLLDEPFSQLDAALRRTLSDELRRLHQQRPVTTLFVTHDQAEALALGDRVAVMKEGAIEQIGAPREIYDRPRTRFVAEFVGEPAMNFAEIVIETAGGELRGRWRESTFSLPREVEKWIQSAGASGLICGVRPEDVILLRHDMSHVGERKGLIEWSVVVERVAFHGAASVVTARLATENNETKPSAEWRAVMTGHEAFQPGERVRLSIDPAKAQWFDPKTGLNVRAEADPTIRAY